MLHNTYTAQLADGTEPPDFTGLSISLICFTQHRQRSFHLHPGYGLSDTGVSAISFVWESRHSSRVGMQLSVREVRGQNGGPSNIGYTLSLPGETCIILAEFIAPVRLMQRSIPNDAAIDIISSSSFCLFPMHCISPTTARSSALTGLVARQMHINCSLVTSQDRPRREIKQCCRKVKSRGEI
jgi:hypothetical protein